MNVVKTKHHRDLSLCKGCKKKRSNGCAYDTYLYARICVKQAIKELPNSTDDEIENLAKKKMRHLPPADERATSNDCPYYTEQLIYDCNYEEDK